MIAIMTPTYNRAYILGKAYESLKKQTSYAFEWIIVDDGSTDDTEAIVAKWMEEEQNFSIIYAKQKNGGKHRAVNKGVQIASCDWFLILDSDDQLTEDAVTKIHKWIDEVSGVKEIAGVAGLKGRVSINGVYEAIGGTPKRPYIDATNLERKKNGLSGDKAEVYKTEIMRQYPFPEFDGENFLRESAVWDHIAMDGLKLRWYSEIIYLCEYIEDGLTKNTNFETYRRNFYGYLYCTKLFLKTHSGIIYLHKCGEFYHVAKSKKLTITDICELLDINLGAMVAGIVVFTTNRLRKSVFNIQRI